MGSFMDYIWCPFCEDDIEVEYTWSGECPKCKNKYYMEEYCTEDYSDCWLSPVWEEANG